MSIGGSFVLVMDISGRGQTSVWPVLGTRGRGEGSWKLLVSEDRLQVLLSVLKEPEVAVSVGGRGKGDGKRGINGRSRLSPTPRHRPAD